VTPLNEVARQTTAAYAGYVVGVADVLGQKSVPDLPGEDRRTLALVLGDAVDDVRGRHARFTAANRPRSDGPAFVVPTQNLAHAAI